MKKELITKGLCKNKDFNKPRRARRSKFPRKFSLFLRVLRALRGKKNAFIQSLTSVSVPSAGYGATPNGGFAAAGY